MHQFLQTLRGRAPGQPQGAQRVLSPLLTATLLLALVAVPVQAQTFPFTALLTSGQEPPPNTNDSKAFGVAFVTFNTETGEVCFSISYDEDKLTSAETDAHFHAPAPPGENAPVIIPLPTGSSKNGCVTPGPHGGPAARAVSGVLVYQHPYRHQSWWGDSRPAHPASGPDCPVRRGRGPGSSAGLLSVT